MRAPSGRRATVAAAVLLVGGVILRGWLWQHEVGPYVQVHGGQYDFNLRWVEALSERPGSEPLLAGRTSD